jgi:hypothetical protein
MRKRFDNRMLYVSAEGTSIVLDVSWPEATGMIPPPSITFYRNREAVVFVYRGTAYQ